MKSIVQWLAATSTLLCSILGTQAHAGSSADSVVKVFTQMRLPNPVRPWVKQNPVEVMGSGVVIERNRITTNAYLSWQVHCRPWQVWHNSVLESPS